MAAPVKDMDAGEVAQRAERARAAQKVWLRYTMTQRVRAIRGLWASLARERERLVALVGEETGKPPAEFESMELAVAGLLLNHFTRSAHRVLQERAAALPWILLNKRAYVRRVPRGVVGLVTPWNMPFLIPLGDSVPALLAGNAVLLKPSEWTTRTALFLEERVRACGLLPEGLFQVCVGAGAVGAEVLKHVDMAVFTGSAATGRKVALAAAERLIPCVLELGGKHAMVVAPDAPLGRAVKAAVWGRFANSGQVCVGVERCLVHEDVYGEFCRRLEKETAALRPAPAASYDQDLGRIIFPAQLDVVERHLADAREKGARVVGGEVDRERLTVTPALVFDAKPEMQVMREETFGPVLPVMPVRRVEEALVIANAGRHGLAASVWTRDLDRGEEWGALLESGLVSVNDVLIHYAAGALPFGGMKGSGLGRRHGDQGLAMFTQEQSVVVHEWPADVPDPWWFPYSRLKARAMAWLSRFA
ncbi:MAG: aldehyde dehydrogenase family protein [Elusimicrobia bacterium]|nr:aldehyde dehydrogenase family protein [Elusimicrobiota bacterium]